MFPVGTYAGFLISATFALTSYICQIPRSQSTFGEDHIPDNPVALRFDVSSFEPDGVISWRSRLWACVERLPNPERSRDRRP